MNEATDPKEGTDRPTEPRDTGTDTQGVPGGAKVVRFPDRARRPASPVEEDVPPDPDGGDPGPTAA